MFEELNYFYIVVSDVCCIICYNIAKIKPIEEYFLKDINATESQEKKDFL